MEREYRRAKRAEGDRPPALELYDTGPWVKRAQELLVRSGFDLGPEADDGRFGTFTATAIAAFRVDHDLRPVPVIGVRLWDLLLKKE
jgi:peptidoglycan hydrolase-like protein with peptidoglycan-binding domain